jgi:hypothetical protein
MCLYVSMSFTLSLRIGRSMESRNVGLSRSPSSINAAAPDMAEPPSSPENALEPELLLDAMSQVVPDAYTFSQRSAPSIN